MPLACMLPLQQLDRSADLQILARGLIYRHMHGCTTLLQPVRPLTRQQHTLGQGCACLT